MILVDFSSLIPRKDDILKFLWESYRVDSISGQWDYIEPVLFDSHIHYFLDYRIRYMRCHFLFILPALTKYICKTIYIAF